MADLIPTQEQSLVTHMASTGKDVKVMACAGSGKTSTLLFVAERLSPKCGLYLAFNKDLAKFAKKKFSGLPVECMTLHGMAFSGAFHASNLFAGKPFQGGILSGSVVADALGYSCLKFLDRDVSPSQFAYLCMDAVRRFCHSADETLSLKHVYIGEKYQKFFLFVRQETEFHLSQAKASGNPSVITLWSNKLDALLSAHRSFRQEILDGAITLWKSMNDPFGLPVTHDVYLKRYVEAVSAKELPLPDIRYAMIDEFQDSNGITVKLVEAFQRSGIQVVFVGDPYQQIYEWRGSVNAFDLVQSDQEARLSQSFRFGPVIANAVNDYMSSVFPVWKEISGASPVSGSIGPIDGFTNAILCRTNSGAVESLIDHLDRGIIPKVSDGRVMSNEIEDICALQSGLRVRSSSDYSVFRSYQELLEYSESNDGLHVRTLLKIIEKNDPTFLINALRHASSLRSSETRPHILTVHKAKGLEWNSVSLQKDFPSREKIARKDEEKRLAYVAMTRGKECLDHRSLFLEETDHNSDKEVIPL